MKTLLLRNRAIWLMACLASILLLHGCSKKPAVERLPAGARVLVLGDSITAGYGLGQEKAWTTTLAQQTGWDVIPAGVSGDTTEGGRSRLPALLDQHQPVAVIIELGGNDMLRRQPLETVKANLVWMIEEVQRRNLRPILLAVPQPSIAGAAFSSLSDAPFYEEIAKSTGVPLIRDALSEVLSQESLRLDQIHPNEAGHQALGQAAAERAKKLGL